MPIGEGGFSHVFSARRDSDGRGVALKIASDAEDPYIGAEAEALRRLGGEVGPTLLASGKAPSGQPYLVLERLTGCTLAEVLGGLPEPVPLLDDACQLFARLCDAVERVHAIGVVHRDLKPENVFLEGGSLLGRPRLIDFGLAVEPGRVPGQSHLHERPGTPEYMAPEQFERTPVDTRTDVYALGVMLFELLAGRPPFLGSAADIEQGHLLHRVPRPSALRPAHAGPIPPAVEEVALGCLQKEAGRRLSGVLQLRQALVRARQAGEIASKEPSLASAPGRMSVALLALRSDAIVTALTEEASGLGATLASMAGDRYVFAFPAQKTARAGVATAARLAERLAGKFEMGVVHVVRARVREGASAQRLLAPALSWLEEWWPKEAEKGSVLFTSEAAELLGASTLSPTPLPGFFARSSRLVVPEPRARTLRGRSDILAALLETARSAFAEGIPTLATVLGEAGLGKSRLLEAVTAELHSVPTAPLVVVLQAGESATHLARLIRLALALREEERSPEQVRAACIERLGEQLGRTAFPAAAWTLGLFSDAHPDVATLKSTPSAWRQTLATAVGRGLRLLAQTRPLALCVDDTHLLDPASLDVLDLLAMGGEPLGVWVCVASQPALLSGRPTWGDRAGRHCSFALTPLDEPSALAMLQELLQPVEFVPQQTLSRLVDLAQGNPLHLTELVAALHRSGAIRPRADTGSWYVAGDDLLDLSPAPLALRLAERELAQLSTPLAALLKLCAVMGAEVDSEEVAAVQGVLESAGSHPAAQLDASVGLARLARRGLLVANPGRHVFRHPMIQEAIEALIPAGERALMHDAVRRLLANDTTGHQRARRAHHAARCGARTEAIRLYVELAESHRHKHEYVKADEAYTAALLQLEREDVENRFQALAGRGKVRYRTWRLRDALDDLRAALEIARDREDAESEVDLLLEQATVLDWCNEYEEAEETAAQAASVGLAPTPALEVRLRLASGRRLLRRDRFGEAIDSLAEASRRGAEVGDHETRAVALVLLGGALAYAGRLDESAARFEEVIGLCSRTGDRLHLGVAYGNRMVLWQRRDPDRAEEDLRRSIQIAREIGHVQLERVGQYNLAEMLLWGGHLDRAIGPALRARSLQLRHYERPGPEDTLLVARIRLARGEVAQARDCLEWIAEHCRPTSVSPVARILCEMVELSIADTPQPEQAWQALMERARAHSDYFNGNALRELLQASARGAERRRE
ncbi:MAG: protein kinase [Myxococcales bacterium]|nr:protein kinase [Myxococcales bacterium]